MDEEQRWQSDHWEHNASLASHECGLGSIVGVPCAMLLLLHSAPGLCLPVFHSPQRPIYDFINFVWIDYPSARNSWHLNKVHFWYSLCNDMMHYDLMCAQPKDANLGSSTVHYLLHLQFSFVLRKVQIPLHQTLQIHPQKIKMHRLNWHGFTGDSNYPMRQS